MDERLHRLVEHQIRKPGVVRPARTHRMRTQRWPCSRKKTTHQFNHRPRGSTPSHQKIRHHSARRYGVSDATMFIELVLTLKRAKPIRTCAAARRRWRPLRRRSRASCGAAAAAAVATATASAGAAAPPAPVWAAGRPDRAPVGPPPPPPSLKTTTTTPTASCLRPGRPAPAPVAADMSPMDPIIFPPIDDGRGRGGVLPSRHSLYDLKKTYCVVQKP